MLKKSQLKNKWDKLKVDFGAWRKLMRKQTGTGWNWDKGYQHGCRVVEKNQTSERLIFYFIFNFLCNTISYFSLHI